MQFPGWTNAWTMPIKTRVDMLTTGVRTPIGIKVFGTDLNEVERVGRRARAPAWRPSRGRAASFTSATWAASTWTSSPSPTSWRATACASPTSSGSSRAPSAGRRSARPIEGRNRFSINVRYPQDLRSDLESLRSVLVPVGGSSSGAAGGGDVPMGTQGALETAPSSDGVRVRRTRSAGRTRSSSPRTWKRWASGRRPARGGGHGAAASARRAAVDLRRRRMALDGADGSAARRWVSSEARAADAGGRHARHRWRPAATAALGRQSFVPLGQVADIKVAGGPPMVRDEAGLLVGYVYVDIDQAQRDIGGYVNEAKEVVAKAMAQRRAEAARPATTSSGRASTSSSPRCWRA